MQGDFLRSRLLNVPGWCTALLIICTCVAVQLHAQSPAFISYDQSSGLSCKEIYDVEQDRKGFMWIASDRGVFRFDGYRFETFTTAQGLTNNTVFRIHEDTVGRLWFLPISGELCYFENGIIVPYLFNDTIKKYLPGVRIGSSIHVTATGTVQLGFLMQGIVEISAKGEFKTISHGPVKGSRIFFAYKGGDHLMLGTESGTAGEKPVLVYRSAESSSLLTTKVGAVRHYVVGLERNDGTSVFCIGEELFEKGAAGSFVSMSLPYQAYCLFEDSQHCLWLGFEGGGARRYAPGASPLSGPYEDFFPGEIITAITEDHEGAFWICTHHSGLRYIPDINIRTWSIFNNDEATALLPGSNGNMFVLWHNNGITEIADGKVRLFTNPAGKTCGAFTWNCARDGIVVSTFDALCNLDTASGEWKILRYAAINCVTCTRKDIYLGSSWNVQRLNSIGEMTRLGDPLIRHRPDVLFTDHNETVWMGALDGLYRIDDTVLVSYAQESKLFTQRITDICELSDSTLVVATQSNGIAFLEGNRIRTITQREGFPCDHIYGVTAGSARSLWCSTKDGLFLLDVQDDTVMFREYSLLKEILSTGTEPCYDPYSNRLWLCGGNRVIVFDPAAMTLARVSPPIHIREVLENDSTLPLNDTAELTHDQNFIRISYSGLAYRLQGNIQYRYRLNPDAEWQFTRENTVQFAALAPGSYTFEIQAQNDNGVWSERPAVYSFIIVPPFWKTWWFIAVLSALLFTITYAAFTYRFRSMRRQDLLREKALIFRQQALASQMNPHFVFNALNTIQSLVLRDRKTEALDMFSSFATLLRKSLEYSTERYITLEEEIRMLNLYFELEEMRFEGKLTYSIAMSDDIVPSSVRIPAMLIQPLVENALLHGVRKRPEGGSVTVSFEMKEGQLYAVVDDNGVGRTMQPDNGRGDKPSGTNITRDRLRVLGEINRTEYTFTITDKTDPVTGQPSGTSVTLALPQIPDQSTLNEKAESIFS